MKEGWTFRVPRHEVSLAGHPVEVGKIVCVGRNYARHNVEMGAEADADPVFFLKPPTALLAGPNLRVSVPATYGELHHEVELAVLVGRRACGLDPAGAPDCVAGFAVALDLTLRDLQAKAKKDGGPWDLAKGFDGSAPIGDFVRGETVADPHDLAIRLEVNDQVRQSARTSSMIHRVPDLIAYVSRFMTLEPGDVLLTGTPEGVGPLVDGDRLVAEIEGLPTLALEITRAAGGVIEVSSGVDRDA